MVRSYAETEGCRRDHILSYFGEEHEVPCFYCDNCDAGLVKADDAARPFPIGAAVTHKSWGRAKSSATTATASSSSSSRSATAPSNSAWSKGRGC